MERFLKRIDAIDQQFREAKAVQEGEVERSLIEPQMEAAAEAQQVESSE